MDEVTDEYIAWEVSHSYYPTIFQLDFPRNGKLKSGGWTVVSIGVTILISLAILKGNLASIEVCEFAPGGVVGMRKVLIGLPHKVCE